MAEAPDAAAHRHHVEAADTSRGDVDCMICIGSFEPGEALATTNCCAHTFHYECLQGQRAAAPVRACVLCHSADDRLGSTYEDNLHPAEGSDHVHRLPLDYQREYLKSRVQASCIICFEPLPDLSMDVVNRYNTQKTERLVLRGHPGVEQQVPVPINTEIPRWERAFWTGQDWRDQFAETGHPSDADALSAENAAISTARRTARARRHAQEERADSGNLRRRINLDSSSSSSSESDEEPDQTAAINGGFAGMGAWLDIHTGRGGLVDRLFDGRGDAGRGRRGFAAAARIMPVPAAGGPESPVRLQPQQQPTPPPQPTPLRRWDRDDALRRSSDGEEEEEEAEEANYAWDDEATVDVRLELPIVFTPTSAQVDASLGWTELPRAERRSGPFATNRTGGRGAAATLAVTDFLFPAPRYLSSPFYYKTKPYLLVLNCARLGCISCRRHKPARRSSRTRCRPATRAPTVGNTIRRT